MQENPVSTEKSPLTKTDKITFILGVFAAFMGISFVILTFLPSGSVFSMLDFPALPSEDQDALTFSDLTGLPLKNASDKTAPAYCIQTPNGTDGGRPQAGMDQAGVVFEAIAEAGITRFAAIYQNPSSAVIGPIRSLRLYYLQWDTPFDCTIVHAGGADDALEAVRGGGYKDLSENYTYMYRGSYGARRWNNLFTTSSNLAAVNRDWKFGNSSIKGFLRMTPDEAARDRAEKNGGEFDATKPASGNTSTIAASVSNIDVNFGGWATFNVRYRYNPATNSYDRSYETGASHDVYVCPENDFGEVNPEDYCTLKQLSPAVVVAMVVDEHRASDGYHEDITTVGSGDAYVFQNGYAIRGTWEKKSVADQIRFYDLDKKEIKLAPGQTFIEAIPSYGSVNY